MNNKQEWLDILNKHSGLQPVVIIINLADWWPQLVNPFLASMSRISSLSNHILSVEVASPVVSYELSIISTQLIEKINNSFPLCQIKKIRFIAGHFCAKKQSSPISISQLERKKVRVDVRDLLTGDLGVSFQRLVDAVQIRSEQGLQDGAVKCRLCGCTTHRPLNGICSGCRFDGTLNV